MDKVTYGKIYKITKLRAMFPTDKNLNYRESEELRKALNYYEITEKEYKEHRQEA